jgi:hypothetical protein
VPVSTKPAPRRAVAEVGKYEQGVSRKVASGAGPSGHNSTTGPRLPIGAFLLTLFGGLLILVEGALLLFAAAVLGSAGYDVASSVSGIGAIVALLGLFLVLLATAVLVKPAAHRDLGVIILVVAAVSFLFGGGFFLGGILGVLGGVLAIVFNASYFESAPPAPPAPPRDRTCRRCGKLFSGDGRECPFCHAPA